MVVKDIQNFHQMKIKMEDKYGCGMLLCIVLFVVVVMIIMTAIVSPEVVK